ncbi:hypothetical protein CONCODRAFT_14849 [Conidiobolus coronatus NRRL 28638]|uniref:Uncharacterized protein n=1 Tax=Conidiobolus coronatus (strain ATCC 28846 / CBS 209.66 / NRRL 28638) TaxID=796925 RepID=A0A137PH94_CONC2|nr:hypothetical protein CONCODRAFT_14849 [Conidiobolus coronatus NRRL 28638]|eukprot:KXN74358.1 hypothetical protein CONCODRAFT_14849 [Conidiobolus coronatus NRRL 28638]
MILFLSLYHIVVNYTLLSQLNAAKFDGPVSQDTLMYSYKDYYSHDTNTCIVSNAIQGITHFSKQVPSIQKCDQSYVINNQTLILPRNTFPICGFTPTYYDTTAKKFTEVYNAGFKNGNTTYENYRKECFEALNVSSKARVEDQYEVKINNATCTRYGEFLTVRYGQSSEISELIDTVKSLISNEIRWNNSKIQATLFISAVCFAVNKEGCVSILEHLLSEKDNSSLNLIGFDIGDSRPSTWLYADGVDIELLHNFAEIMGMDVETKVVKDIPYHNIKRSRTTEYYEFDKKKPGLVGGFPKN